jgi:hypothetical protein
VGREWVVSAKIKGILMAESIARRLRMSVQVGREAPDFTAAAYHQGQAKQVKLSDYRDKWVMLCFYPADFTCV